MKPEEIFIIKELEKIQIQISEATYTKLFSYIQHLLFVNKITNLTSITDYSNALIKHLYDSLVILKHPIFLRAQKIIDVGSGGGLPSIPLAICTPDKKFASIEATRKKVDFQKEICQDLHITNHIAIWGRAEELGQDPLHRQEYDLVIARALAATDILAELTLPFAKINGYTFFYKAKEYQNELIFADNAIKSLGGLYHSIIEIQLPANAGERNILILQKVKNTHAKFPRRPGIPQKTPIK
jgi:16S rRNA (guanine527-N7)-methyltransferase